MIGNAISKINIWEMKVEGSRLNINGLRNDYTILVSSSESMA